VKCAGKTFNGVFFDNGLDTVVMQYGLLDYFVCGAVNV